jgi:superfamily II DNA or RNA helicase
MRLIIGHPLDDAEFSAVKHGYRLSELFGDLNDRLIEIIDSADDKASFNLTLLSMLIATERLDIRFAFRRQGMYHEKIGVLYDSFGDRLVFQGSANETVYALSQGYNAESIMVFKSWDASVFESYGSPCVIGFERLWNGDQLNTITVKVPSSFYETIALRTKKVDTDADLLHIEEDLNPEELKAFTFPDKTFNRPQVPTLLRGRPFKILEHQKKAVSSWINNDYKGILKLSTGSGKTITSIYAATKVFEARAVKGASTVLIVAVPYQELAKQWVANLELFNICPIRCWQSKNAWVDDLKKELIDLKMRAINFVSIVVVNRTLEGAIFRDIIRSVSKDSIMLIGDECHNHGGRKVYEALPDAFYRMGLSATPYRSDDDELENPFPNDAKERINSYYQKIVAEYSLGDAIHDGVLCEYNYHIIPVYLTPDEEELYVSISTEIGQIIAVGAGNLSSNQRNQLTMLCGKRSRLLGSAANKLVALEEIVRTFPAYQRKHSLFYCGEGRQESEMVNEQSDLRVIEAVSKVLSSAGWNTSRFTSQESPNDRKRIMDNFIHEHIDALVSMKVLDEGVDVPVCDKAFILASTRNPRQYVQRRGRVLRKAEGKTLADIYDFVILPTGTSAVLDALRRAELERIDDFVLIANNRFDVESEVERLDIRK